jgi:hypothetical protein
MNRYFLLIVIGVVLLFVGSDASGRGFGGFRGGSFGGYSRSFSSFGGENRFGGVSYGSRSVEGYSGWGGRGVGGTYDHSWTSASGATLSTSGSRGIAEGRFGGFAVGGTRDTTLTTASGRTFSGERTAGGASGPLGRTVGGASGSIEGRYGGAGWESAFSGNRYVGNMGHYASVYGANGLHSTAYWSRGFMDTRAGFVRTGFGYYNCFHPAWYAAHPGCWLAASWAVGAAWRAPTYVDVSGFCGFPSDDPPDYDYGTTVVYQDNSVYVNGQDAGTAQQFADQATAIATQGQTAEPPATDDWQPLGVFALVQGDDKTSNNIFQLAVNKDGIIRGNYYDGLMDSTTEVFGSIDKKTQRAAWTLGKKKDRVFEAGVYNLTQPQCPCLVHLGAQKTSQMLLVRVEQPKNGAAQPAP